MPVSDSPDCASHRVHANLDTVVPHCDHTHVHNFCDVDFPWRPRAAGESQEHEGHQHTSDAQDPALPVRALTADGSDSSAATLSPYQGLSDDESEVCVPVGSVPPCDYTYRELGEVEPAGVATVLHLYCDSWLP